MKIDTTTISRLLNILRDDLIASKNGAHEYIDLILLELSTASTPAKTNSILKQLKSSAKMIDYANFTSHQERLWTDVWQEATRLLQQNS